MTAKLGAKNDMIVEPKNAMARCLKFLVPNHLCHVLEALCPKAQNIARAMIKNRDLSSSKYWKEIPCVIAKSLITSAQPQMMGRSKRHARTR